MSWTYRKLVRPVLFSQDSERIHNHTLTALGGVSRNALARNLLKACYHSAALPVSLFGLQFPNPVGLAAGMDKSANALPIWNALGFGFTELGGITWEAQPGNPKPRMFRAVSEQALINRMGFNNIGAEAMALKLAAWRQKTLWPSHPVGINLGKSKSTPLGKAPEDYAQSLRTLWPHADFFVINVSSPNTPGLRTLQDKTALREILAAVQTSNATAAQSSSTFALPKPVLIKIAPDLEFGALDELLELAMVQNISGIIATNTTIARPATSSKATQAAYAETGGLSGRPLALRSTEIIRHVYRQTNGKLPIIGVGGIFNALDAWEKITAGASLIQIYTGLVFEGPNIAKSIVKGLQIRLSQSGFKTVLDVRGIAT